MDTVAIGMRRAETGLSRREDVSRRRTIVRGMGETGAGLEWVAGWVVGGHNEDQIRD